MGMSSPWHGPIYLRFLLSPVVSCTLLTIASSHRLARVQVYPHQLLPKRGFPSGVIAAPMAHKLWTLEERPCMVFSALGSHCFQCQHGLLASKGNRFGLGFQTLQWELSEDQAVGMPVDAILITEATLYSCAHIYTCTHKSNSKQKICSLENENLQSHGVKKSRFFFPRYPLTFYKTKTKQTKKKFLVSMVFHVSLQKSSFKPFNGLIVLCCMAKPYFP